MEKHKKDLEYKRWRNKNCTKYMFDIYWYKDKLWDDWLLYRKYKQLMT